METYPFLALVKKYIYSTKVTSVVIDKHLLWVAKPMIEDVECRLGRLVLPHKTEPIANIVWAYKGKESRGQLG